MPAKPTPCSQCGDAPPDQPGSRAARRRAEKAERAGMAEFESLQHAAARTELSVWTFRNLVASGELPAYRLSEKPGAAIRVKIADVNALMRPVLRGH